MPEKKLRTIILGVILWGVLFTLATLAAYKLDEDNIDIFMLIAIPIFCVVLAYIYMRGTGDKSVYEGTRLGFTWLMILLTLDVIVRVYILDNDWEYFRSWTVWIAFAEIVFLCGAIGALSKPVKAELEQVEAKKKAEEKSSKTEGETYFAK
jgi:hypothetical protein